MVGALDLPGLKNLKVGMETLDLMGFPRDRVTVVLNRADSKVGLGVGDVKEILRPCTGRGDARPTGACPGR